jgi:cellulose synthase/poly-beta-1,6-N-acetylglucosamine synthase-like glycosyltransferase
MLQLIIWILYTVILYVTVFQIIVFLEKEDIKSETEWLDSWPTLTVTVPAYNEENTIEMTLDSILSAEYPQDKLEIIVVDDGSEDATAEKVEEYTDRENVKLVSQENQGKGAALNTGLEEATGEFFACVDADSRLKEDSLKNIISGFDEDTAAIASAMKVHNPKNMIQRVQWLEYLVGIFTRSLMARINAIHVTPGPLSVYRTEVLRDVGGFDEESLVEDQEICFRMQRNHWKVEHSRKGEVFTVAPDSMRALYRQRKRWYRGSLQNILKYRDMIFNKEYGEFGYFALPSKVIMGVLSVATVLLITYMTLTPLLDFAFNFLQIGLDMFTLSNSFSLGILLQEAYWSLISMRMTTYLLLATMFFLSALLTYLAGKHTEEKILGQGIIPATIYVAWFVFFIGFMWLVVGAKIVAEAVVNLR